MIFEPKTEDEIQEKGLLQKGIYKYKVVNASEKCSSKGNQYIALTLEIDEENRKRLIFTNLAFIKLIKHFCDVNNLQESYQHGSLLAEDCLNKNGGYVCIDIEKEKPDGKGGVYRAKNIVIDYVQHNQPSILTILHSEINEHDDCIPF